MEYFDYVKWQILIASSDNMWVGYILVTKMGISCKFHINDQQMRLCMLCVYIIHVKCVNIIMSHHLQLDVGRDLIYATN
jgi:hypothetical protein